ncbi:MAG: hypothetical protein AVDCRST_MAG50-2715, partial [uncultured Acidimicrobiales bacterium]
DRRLVLPERLLTSRTSRSGPPELVIGARPARGRASDVPVM